MIGSTNGFRLLSEWDRPDGVAAPELAATWARLEMWADSTCITQVEDAEVGSARRGIYCSLYPLAEWVAFNWWLLQAHARPASLGPSSSAWSAQRGTSHPAWLKHHNIRAAGDGFAWPDLAVLPSGDRTRIVWRADRAKTSSKPIRYLVDGDADVPSALVTRALAEVVEAVLARLDEQGITASPLAEEWRAISEATTEEREFCIAAARMGRDPYALPTDLAELLMQAANELKPDLLADFLDAADPATIGAELDWVKQTSSDIDELEASPSLALDELRRQTRGANEPSQAPPWSRGFRQARLVRKIMGLAPTEPFPLNGLINYRESFSEARGFQGLGGLTRRGGETLMLSRPFPEDAARFAGARALWHFAIDDTTDRFLLTRAHGDRQSVARSFAAELLAPADGIRELLGTTREMAAEEDIESIATAFRVSSLVVDHQILNQLTPE
ncbi:MAG: ImmA/IrrE family metallo-endopeptidase [Solirubrobacteraceae bacterium]